jgi:hypothetical protein
MKALVQSAFMAILAAVPAVARAANTASTDAPRQYALDMDHDGKLDRAWVKQDSGDIYAALYLFLGYGAGPFDRSRKPTFVKKDLTTDPIISLAGNGKGALIVSYGRVGLGSNQYETKLTIVYRRGEFWVAGLAASWDMRDGSVGSCDINFFTGKGVAARGNGKNRPVKAKFTPVKLADWSDDKRPKACR